LPVDPHLFGTREAENPVEALVVGERAAPVSGVEPLGGRLAMPSQDANYNRRNDPARRQHPGHAGKSLNQLVIERNYRFIAPGTPLAPCAPEQLAIDPGGLVIFGQNHMQAARLYDRRMLPEHRPAALFTIDTFVIAISIRCTAKAIASFDALAAISLFNSSRLLDTT
jgi:hypothetical protein